MNNLSYKPSSVAATLWAYVAALASIIVLTGGGAQSTPSTAALQKGCAKHGGIISVSNGSAFQNDPVIVCKDGKVWFVK